MNPTTYHRPVDEQLVNSVKALSAFVAIPAVLREMVFECLGSLAESTHVLLLLAVTELELGVH